MQTKLSLLFVLVVLGVGSLLSQTIVHPWHVIDNGGGKSSAGGINLHASIGQPAVQAMAASGISLEGGYIPGIRFLSGTTSVMDQSLENGWNLVSVPFIVSDFRKTILYPTATTSAFAYQGSYVQRETLKNTVGYWLKYSGGTTNHFSGTSIVHDTVKVNDRWNMIGSLSYPTLITDITPLDTTTLVSHFYGYANGSGYFVEDTLKPGKAYWIKVHNAGKVFLKTGSVTMDPAAARLAVKDAKKQADAKVGQDKLNVLTVRDANASERVLYFSSNVPPDELQKWEMPPHLEGIMDARFASNRMLESDEQNHAKDAALSIKSAEYPLTISWKVKSEMKGARLRIDEKEVTLTATGETRILNPESIIRLSFAPASVRELPKQFALYQNFPNPFNPTTIIRYDLPRQSHVRIMIYDALGQEVKQLIAGEQEAGFQSIEWNSTNSVGNTVASGMYFYRIEAMSGSGGTSAFTEVRKMLLVR